MGIGQLFKKREEPQEEENLKEMFENIKSQEIPETRKKVINFTYVSKCGCGSTSENLYHAIVPEDYEGVKDGDLIDSDYDKMKALEDVAGAVYEGEYTGSVEDHNPDDYYGW
jgi:hypothetical protein|nr:MAG TPA: hypothetical protein [Crassvirales sp.]